MKMQTSDASHGPVEVLETEVTSILLEDLPNGPIQLLPDRGGLRLIHLLMMLEGLYV